MLVESKIRRQGGTTIDLYGKTYKFLPNEFGDHVAEVTDEAALNRLVNEIPSGYALYGADADQTVSKPASNSTSFSHPLNTGTQREPDTLIVRDGENKEIDLMQMDREEAAAFARVELAIKVHPKWTIEVVRAKILEAIRAASPEE